MASDGRLSMFVDLVPGTMTGAIALNSQLVSINNVLQNLTNMFADKFGIVNATLVTTGIYLAQVGLQAAEAFGEFEQSMKIVQMVSGQTRDEINQLGQAANQFSVQYRTDIDQITEGLQTLGRAGLNSATEQTEVLQNGLSTAKLEGRELNKVLEELIQTTALLGGNLKSNEFGEQTGYVNNLLVGTSMTAPITTHDVNETLKYSGGIAAAAGANIETDDGKRILEDYMGAIAAFAQKGVTGSIAGTALRAFFNKPATQDSSVVEGLAMIKLKPEYLWEDGGDVMKPVSEQIQIIQNQMDELNISTMDRLQIWSKIVGGKMGQQMMKLESDDIKKLTSDIRNASDAQDLANRSMQTYASNVKELGERGDAAFRNFGEGIVSVINPYLEIINLFGDMIGKVNDFTQGLLPIKELFGSAFIGVIGAMLMKLRGLFSVIKGEIAQVATSLKELKGLEINGIPVRNAQQAFRALEGPTAQEKLFNEFKQGKISQEQMHALYRVQYRGTGSDFHKTNEQLYNFTRAQIKSSNGALVERGMVATNKQVMEEFIRSGEATTADLKHIINNRTGEWNQMPRELTDRMSARFLINHWGDIEEDYKKLDTQYFKNDKFSKAMKDGTPTTPDEKVTNNVPSTAQNLLKTLQEVNASLTTFSQTLKEVIATLSGVKGGNVGTKSDGTKGQDTQTSTKNANANNQSASAKNNDTKATNENTAANNKNASSINKTTNSIRSFEATLAWFNKNLKPKRNTNNQATQSTDAAAKAANNAATGSRRLRDELDAMTAAANKAAIATGNAAASEDKNATATSNDTARTNADTTAKEKHAAATTTDTTQTAANEFSIRKGVGHSLSNMINRNRDASVGEFSFGGFYDKTGAYTSYNLKNATGFKQRAAGLGNSLLNLSNLVGGPVMIAFMAIPAIINVIKSRAEEFSQTMKDLGDNLSDAYSKRDSAESELRKGYRELYPDEDNDQRQDRLLAVYEQMSKDMADGGKAFRETAAIAAKTFEADYNQEKDDGSTIEKQEEQISEEQKTNELIQEQIGVIYTASAEIQQALGSYAAKSTDGWVGVDSGYQELTNDPALFFKNHTQIGDWADRLSEHDADGDRTYRGGWAYQGIGSEFRQTGEFQLTGQQKSSDYIGSTEMTGLLLEDFKDAGNNWIDGLSMVMGDNVASFKRMTGETTHNFWKVQNDMAKGMGSQANMKLQQSMKQDKKTWQQLAKEVAKASNKQMKGKQVSPQQVSRIDGLVRKLQSTLGQGFERTRILQAASLQMFQDMYQVAQQTIVPLMNENTNVAAQTMSHTGQTMGNTNGTGINTGNTVAVAQSIAAMVAILAKAQAAESARTEAAAAEYGTDINADGKKDDADKAIIDAARNSKDGADFLTQMNKAKEGWFGTGIGGTDAVQRYYASIYEAAALMTTRGMDSETAKKAALKATNEAFDSGAKFDDIMNMFGKNYTANPSYRQQIIDAYLMSDVGEPEKDSGSGSGSGGSDKDSDKDKGTKKERVDLVLCNKREIPKLNVNLFKKPPSFTVLNKNFKLRDIKVNTQDKPKAILSSIKNAIIDVQKRSDPKIIQDEAGEYDPVAATEGSSVPSGTTNTESTI